MPILTSTLPPLDSPGGGGDDDDDNNKYLLITYIIILQFSQLGQLVECMAEVSQEFPNL